MKIVTNKDCTYCKEKLSDNIFITGDIHWECMIIKTFFEMVNDAKIVIKGNTEPLA